MLHSRHPSRTRRFSLGFGGFYLALALIGWRGPGWLSFLSLGVADHVFHFIVGTVSRVVGLPAWQEDRPAVAEPASR